MSDTKRTYNKLLARNRFRLYHPYRQRYHFHICGMDKFRPKWKHVQSKRRRRAWANELRMLLRMERTGFSLTCQRYDHVYDEWNID